MASVDKMAIIGEDFSEDEPKRDGAAKACYDCYLVVYNATKICPECGYRFYNSQKDIRDGVLFLPTTPAEHR